MPKELTLEDLANSAKPNASTEKPPVAGSSKPVMGEATNSKGKEISVSDLTDHLKKTNPNPEPTPREKMEDAPLVKNAFEDMVNTLNKRKRRIDEELMPIVEANAHDMAMAEAQGIDTSTTKLGEREESVEEAYIPDSTPKAAPAAAAFPEPDPVDDEFDLDKALAAEDGEESYEEAPPVNNSQVQQTATKPQQPVKASAVAREEESVVTADATIEDDSELEALMRDLEASSDDEVVDTEEETPEETRERFKESMKNIKVARDPIDLTKFTIRREAVSSNAVLNSVDQRNGGSFKRADWVLFNTGRSVTFKECRGADLDNLRRTIQNSNGVNGVIASLKFIYDHIIDANKPAFEAWTKLIRTEDVESLYFGLYRACYADNNLVPRECNGEGGCNKRSLVECDINKMVKFEDDETKAKFDELFTHDTTTDTHAFESTMIQISDDFVISYSPATLYSTFIQYSTLKPEITEKYDTTLNTMAYIDGFFSIDHEHNQLVPIAIRKYPNNLNKTIISKLKVYTDILKRLTNDQYNILTAKLNNVIGEPNVTYVYPECTCPECGATIPEEPCESMIQLLFTRAQLVQIKSL